MLPLDFLGVAFACSMLFRVEVTRVRAPIICIIVREPEGLQQRLELEKDGILATTKDIRQDRSRVVVNSMPQPAWVAFVADKRPHLIYLSFAGSLNIYGHLRRVQCAQQRGIHRLQHGFFLLEFTQHGVGTNVQRSRRIAYPAGIETHIDDRVLDFRQAPAVAIVEQETSFDTKSVLTEVALGAPGCFAAFDDLVTLTVRAADGDERHGPFLPMGGYEDEVQCDINLSPSPLLKHYPSPTPA